MLNILCFDKLGFYTRDSFKQAGFLQAGVAGFFPCLFPGERVDIPKSHTSERFLCSALRRESRTFSQFSVKVFRTHLCECYYKSVTRDFVVVLL